MKEELPLAIAGMASPIQFILGKRPDQMSDVELRDLVEKARQLGSSPQSMKAALGTPVGAEKRVGISLAAKALAIFEDEDV